MLCGLSHQGEYLGSGFTDPNGHAVIAVVGTLPEGETVTLTVTAYNRIPWIGQLAVLPLPLPAIACDPDSFEVTLDIDAQLVDTLSLANVGQAGSILDYDAYFTCGITNPRVFLEPTDGSIPAGQSESVLVTFDSASLVPGIYLGSIVVDYDPGQTTTIPAKLHVEDAAAAGHGHHLASTCRFAMDGPDPSSSATMLRFSLPGEQSVRVAVFDAAGRLVRVLCQGLASAGDHFITWDGRDTGGRAVPPGVYFRRLSTAQEDLTRTVLRVR